MILGAANHRAGLKHHGRRIVVREKYQRPEVKDLGTKWRMGYWDYSLKPRRKRSTVWSKQTAPSNRQPQGLAQEVKEKVNARNTEPRLYGCDDETLASLIAQCREK